MGDSPLNPDFAPFVAGMSPETTARLRSDDPQGLARALVFLAHGWIRMGGSDIRARDAISATDLAAGNVGDQEQTTPEQRAILAAGCQLYDVLANSPHGRKALRDLVLQPRPKDSA